MNLQRKAGVTLLIICPCIVGCAGLSTGTVSAESKANGFRYYQPAPFLLVHSDGKGGVTGDIVWLPDTTDEMSARPFAVLASNNAQLKFSNGMLSEASSQVDETVVPNAILSAVGKILTGVVAAEAPLAESPAPPDTAPPPYLFRVIIKGGEIELFGVGAPNEPIHATVNGSSP